MKLAFLLYKYFPFGGMQRDFQRFAQESHRRGHSIRVYCINWQGDIPDAIELRQVPVKAWSNHRRNQKYYEWVQKDLAKEPVDGVIGFNKMPGLDVYYAADSCYIDKSIYERGRIYRLSRRFKHFKNYEESVFGGSSTTQILLISETEKKKFKTHYFTDEARMHMLPPGISLDRRAKPNSDYLRIETRNQLQVSSEDVLLLFIGSGFIKKGLDRVIRAIASFSIKKRQRLRLIVVGQDKEKRYKKLSSELGVAKNISFVGGRDDVPTLLSAADLLIHPALDEAAGIVLLEAIVAGLPVLATDVCGYAYHVAKANAGEVLKSPFRQKNLNEALKKALNVETRAVWKKSALSYADSEDLYSMHITGAKLIEKFIKNKQEKDA